MSLTQTHHLFGGISETGINNFLDVFFTARPHLLAYGTPSFATNQTAVTLLDTSSLPSFLLGLECLIRFDLPKVDIYPPSVPGELLPPANNQFTLFSDALILFVCGTRGDKVRGGDANAHDIAVKFRVAILCAPRVVNNSPGTGAIGIQLVQVKITGLATNGLEQILECILTRILTWALAQIVIPFNVFTLDGVSLTLQQGPLATDNQIEVRGDIS
jgi:hypothetical protein